MTVDGGGPHVASKLYIEPFMENNNENKTMHSTFIVTIFYFILFYIKNRL